MEIENTNQEIVNQKGNLIIILGVVVLLLLAAGGISYLLLANKNAPSLPVSQNNKTTVNNTTGENINAITGDVKLSYLFNPHDNQKIILKQIDFKTNTSKEVVLPYFSKYSRDESKNGRYIVSPNGKYVLRLTRNLLEIAELPNPTFRTVYKIESMTDPKLQKLGETIGMNLDFAHVDDAMWDDKGKLYFVTGVGLDGVGGPEGGVYTNLYVANEDGSNVKLINDHTKENQNYGFMKHFSYIDTVKNDIYFSGDAHGGHLSTMIVVDANTGVLKQSLRDIYTDIVNPVFNKDFSKAYYEQDFKEEGYLNPVKIYEYDMATKNKRVIYTVPNATEDYINSPQLVNYSFGALRLNQDLNKLYFQVREGGIVHYYVMDLISGKQTKLFSDDSGDCGGAGISSNEDYLLLDCRDLKAKLNENRIYQVSTGKKATYYNEQYTDEFAEPSILQIVSFN